MYLDMYTYLVHKQPLASPNNRPVGLDGLPNAPSPSGSHLANAETEHLKDDDRSIPRTHEVVDTQ